MRIYLAVGHGVTPAGRDDPGASGGGWDEQSAGDLIVQQIADRLKAWGADVRHEAYADDPNFYGSTRAANAWGADLLLAVHHDIATAPDGSFAYHAPGSSKGWVFAESIIHAITEDRRPTRPAWLGPGKGFASGPVAERGLYILTESHMPAVLLEVGAIGSDLLDEPDELLSIADVIAVGIANHAGLGVRAAGDAVEPVKEDVVSYEQAVVVPDGTDRWDEALGTAIAAWHTLALVEADDDGNLTSDGRTAEVGEPILVGATQGLDLPNAHVVAGGNAEGTAEAVARFIAEHPVRRRPGSRLDI